MYPTNCLSMEDKHFEESLELLSNLKLYLTKTDFLSDLQEIDKNLSKDFLRLIHMLGFVNERITDIKNDKSVLGLATVVLNLNLFFQPIVHLVHYLLFTNT